MIKKLTRLLGNMGGRIKEYMSKAEYYMMVATMLMPLGIIVFSEW